MRLSTLKTMALSLWWCEGSKTRKDTRWKNSYSYAIEITNTNPKIIKIFLDYLRNEIKVPESKLRGQIQIHEGDNQLKIEHFWSEYLNLPISQLNKTIIRPKGNRFRNNFGTFKLRLYDKKIYNTLLTELDKQINKI